MSELAVRCAGLDKTFRATRAVAEFDLALEAGVVLSLLGPSGCGKTTALRLIAGFERPDAGTIEISGRVVAGGRINVPPEKRRVGVVFQDYALFPHLTVAANVAFGIRRGSDKKKRTQEMLALVGLGGLDARLPHELSGGQQQRVALARALAPNPEVLLLDEPFSNLDAGLRSQLRDEVAQILRATETTAVFVTHDREEALFMGDLIAVMNAGRVEQVAAPEELFHMPRSRFAAEFLGIADFLPATATADGLQTEIGTARTANNGRPGERVDVMVRPDDLVMEASTNGQARITRATFRGGHILYEVTLASGRTIRVVKTHTSAFATGTAVDVRLAPGHPLVHFPRDTK